MNNKNRKRTPMIGEVYMMQFTGTGSEQQGWRPGVIFQNNTGNRYSPNVIVLPLTSSIKKMSQPTHVFLPAAETGLKMDSVVLCENPEKMSKAKLGKFITKLPDEYMKAIAYAHIIATSAISFLNLCEITEAWEKAVRCNSIA